LSRHEQEKTVGMDLLAEQRAEREERILEAARSLIETVGYEGVTIRDLARESRVSVPTLYKFFGDKDTLLVRAVETRFTAVIQSVGHDSAVRGLERLLAILEGCCREMVRTSRYSKAVLAVFVRSGKTSSVMQVVGRDLTEELTKVFDEMLAAGDLEDWIDPAALAERLAAHQLMVCLEWESGHLTNKALYPVMAYGAALMILGVCKGRARARIQKLAASLQSEAITQRRRGARK
jgi:AcrR family transcriptional regulator